MGVMWRSECYLATIGLIKSELQVLLTLITKCGEFYHFPLGQKNLLDAAASNKYVVKKLRSYTIAVTIKC